jgi:phage terminase small subunit
MPLTNKQQRFVEEYLIDLNATQAAIRAGYSVKTAQMQSSRLLSNDMVDAEIQAAIAERSEKTEILAADVLERWWAIANADAGELSAYRRLACRYCHGKNHKYQWIDEQEYNQAVQQALAQAAELEDEAPVMMPSIDGGYGFSKSADPHPDCPHCDGEGIADVWFADTRKLSPGAAMLFDGVKQTNQGIEIKVRDRDAALANVARHLGMYNDKVQVEVTDRSAILDKARKRAGG